MRRLAPVACAGARGGNVANAVGTETELFEKTEIVPQGKTAISKLN